MKKLIVLTVLAFISFTSVLLADKTGVGTERGQDRTGSPVGSAQQCNQCHSGGNFNTTITTRLKDSGGNIVTEYNGGEVYTYEVEIGGTGAKHGFQTVALLSNNANAGNMTAVSTNAKVITMNNRKYAEHTAASVSNLFVMEWTAPSPGSGNVKFYAAGNNVNANNASSGDQVAVAGALTITESAVSAVADTDSNFEITVYPVPATDQFTVKIPSGKIVDITVYNYEGKEIKYLQNVTENVSVDSQSWEKGVYFIRISGDLEANRKLIVN